MRLAPLLAIALAACSPDIVASAGLGGDGGVPPYCLGNGPPIIVGDGITVGEGNGIGDDVCTGTVAVRTFRNALCTCQDYVTSTRLTTDSFDSALGPYAAGGTAGPVGIDGALQTNDVVDVGGTLSVGAAASLGADLDVTGDTAIGGNLGTGVAVQVGGDAYVAGDVNLSSLTVGGTLTVPSGNTITAGTLTTGATVRAPVGSATPCACGPLDLVDIAAFVASNKDQNEDGMIGLDPSRLTGYAGDTTLELPCGRYFLNAVHGDGALTLRATGRVALLVEGDFTMTSPFTIELSGSDAEIDLMISGLFTSNNTVHVGDPAHPARTRIYVGGQGQILLSGDSQVAGNVYAPRASLEVSGGATVYGSLFVDRLDQSAPVTIHYDTDVQHADNGC